MCGAHAAKQGEGVEPEQAAKLAIASQAKPGARPGNVWLVLTLELCQALAEQLNGRAIREDKNLEVVVIDLLEGNPEHEK